jgi:hypothetical protein
MTQDVPVFRSEAPHQVAVPESGADALSPSPVAGSGGPIRQIVDSKVFAPLDEPRQLAEIEVLADDTAREHQTFDTGSDAATPDAAASPDSEPPAVRATRIRTLSPDLVERAREIQAETESISRVVDAVIDTLPDFDRSDLPVTESSVLQLEPNQSAVEAKE